MATIKPFRGSRFDPETVGSLSRLICPPHDVIDPWLQKDLERRSPFNAVHLEANAQINSAGRQTSHRRVARLFERWHTDGVLRRDAECSFYLMHHSYPFGGRRYKYSGLFADVLVENYDRGTVVPHELTAESVVQDLADLLHACQAQFSPIMSLYQDSASELHPIFDAISAGRPEAFAATPTDGEVLLWRIADSATQSVIIETFADRPVFLADGHHRYEAALRYRRAQSEAQQSDGRAASNYVMMTLVDFDDPGLLLLPYHRVVTGASPQQLAEVRSNIYRNFNALPLQPDITPDAAIAQVARAGEGMCCFAVFWADSAPTIFSKAPGADRASWGSLAASEAWVLQERVLFPALGDAMTYHIDFSPDQNAVVQAVKDGHLQAAILFKPLPSETLRQILSDGFRLPSKSTFFHPKLPNGLVFNQISGMI